MSDDPNTEPTTSRAGLIAIMQAMLPQGWTVVDDEYAIAVLDPNGCAMIQMEQPLASDESRSKFRREVEAFNQQGILDGIYPAPPGNNAPSVPRQNGPQQHPPRHDAGLPLTVSLGLSALPGKGDAWRNARRAIQIVIVAACGVGGWLGGIMSLGCCFSFRWSLFGEIVSDSYLAPVPPAEIARAMAAGNLRLLSFARLPYSSSSFELPIGGTLVVEAIAVGLGIVVGLWVARALPR